MHTFSFNVRIYYEDTDSGGVVYHANYLKFMERARTEWLRAVGYSQNDLKDKFGLIIVVHALNIDYHYPARFDDALTVTSKLIKVGGSSFMFEQIIKRNESVLTSAKVRLVCVDANKFKPMAIPQEIKDKMVNDPMENL